MKKILLLFIAVYFMACESTLDEGFENDPARSELETDLKSTHDLKAKKYDKFIVKFAKSLSKSLEDEALRQMIKEDAMKQVDGDYDIIWKTFKNKIHGINSKRIAQIISDNIESTQTGNNLNELEAFGDEFKKFQLSVPVNCDEWMPGNYRPVVAYMLSDYDEEDEYINAFDENGKKITLSMATIPEVPVIVVGLNERSDEEGNILEDYRTLEPVQIEFPEEPVDPRDPIYLPPAPPTGLSASTVNTGIYLSWTAPSPALGATGYVVERKGDFDTDFLSVKLINGLYNTTFTDVNITPSYTYSYRVRAANIIYGTESTPSNIVAATAPNFPNPPTSFNVEHVVQRESKLNWINDNNQLITENRIYRYNYTSGSNYQLIATLPASSSNYFDRNVSPGKYEYMIKHYNNQGESSGKTDFVHIPYRNIQSSNPIYIKNISFTSWQLERWPAGKPEFRINVFNVNRASKQSYNVVSNVNFDFSSKTTSCDFTNRCLINWNQDIWYDVLTISMVEYDEQWGPHKITLSATAKFKASDNLGIEAGAKIEWDITDDYEDCGKVYIDFYEQPEKTYYFQNYGARITISENP